MFWYIERSGATGDEGQETKTEFRHKRKGTCYSQHLAVVRGWWDVFNMSVMSFVNLTRTSEGGKTKIMPFNPLWALWCSQSSFRWRRLPLRPAGVVEVISRASMWRRTCSWSVSLVVFTSETRTHRGPVFVTGPGTAVIKGSDSTDQHRKTIIKPYLAFSAKTSVKEQTSDWINGEGADTFTVLPGPNGPNGPTPNTNTFPGVSPYEPRPNSPTGDEVIWSPVFVCCLLRNSRLPALLLETCHKTEPGNTANKQLPGSGKRGDFTLIPQPGEGSEGKCGTRR